MLQTAFNQYIICTCRWQYEDGDCATRRMLMRKWRKERAQEAEDGEEENEEEYEVRSKTKLAFRVVESLFRFVSLCTEFVSLTSQIISSWIGPIRLVANEFVASITQIVLSWSDLSPPSSSRRVARPTHHASLLFDSSSAEFVLSNSGIDSSWVDR